MVCSRLFAQAAAGRRSRRARRRSAPRDAAARGGGEHVEVACPCAPRTTGASSVTLPRTRAHRCEDRVRRSCAPMGDRARGSAATPTLAIEQAQVVRDLGHGGDRRVRARARGALLERDRRRHAAHASRRRAAAWSAGTGARTASASRGSAAGPRRRRRRTRACSCPSRSAR